MEEKGCEKMEQGESARAQLKARAADRAHRSASAENTVAPNNRLQNSPSRPPTTTHRVARGLRRVCRDFRVGVAGIERWVGQGSAARLWGPPPKQQENGK